MQIAYDPNNKSKCNQTVSQGSELPTTGSEYALTLRTYQALYIDLFFEGIIGQKFLKLPFNLEIL